MSDPAPVVPDASPLIALERIDRLDLVQGLYGRVLVPPAVAREVFGSESPPSWVEVVTPSLNPVLPSHLGAGEREAIALAAQVSARALILDDLPARRVAAARGLPVLGTVAILLAAKRQGRLHALAPVVEELLEAGFRLSDKVRVAVLRAAGEEGSADRASHTRGRRAID